MPDLGRIAVICGGVGAARLLRGLVEVVDPAAVTAVVNVADDTEMHGLHVSPDLDTVMYTLADAIDPERGWGLRDESWQAMAMFGRYGNPTWFNLGDRDLATHIVRTQRLGLGSPLSSVTDELARAWGVGVRLLPVSDDAIRTRVTTEDGELSFQEYFVGRHHQVAVRALRFDGIDHARPAPGVVEALTEADLVVIAPSNPLVSVEPVLAVDGIRALLRSRRSTVVAVSPIVAGAALKGPADRMLHELGHESSVVGIASLYRDVAATLVIDEADRGAAAAVAAEGVGVVVTDTVMADVGRAAGLARRVVTAV